MNDPLDNMKTMQRDPSYDTIGDMLTQRPDEAIVLAGRYRIVRKLGEGGMGSVWLAEDTKLDGRQVAIKMLPVVLVANKRAIQQLKAEAKVAIRLAHPSIATLRGFEEAEEGPFLVMDYIEGQTLEDILAVRGALPEDEVYRLFAPIAQALDYAHAQKVIHRDIKPSNILVREDSVPFVADFGIAREMKDTMTRVTGRCTSGTLPYMSPEQLRGEPPTPQQDIYSLAATMYQAMAGHPPFFRGQIEWQVVNEEAPPLEQLRENSILALMIMQGLAKVSWARPPTAAHLLGRLDDDGYTEYVLGREYRKCVPPNHEEAEAWIHRASSLGWLPAMQDRGSTLLVKARDEGCGFDEALALLYSAAEKGAPYAMYNLGTCFKEGYGVARDAQVAISWYERAASGSYDEQLKADAKRTIDEMNAQQKPR
jgi:serine/threonine protein kinase